MRSPSDPAPGSYDDVLQRRMDALRASITARDASDGRSTGDPPPPPQPPPHPPPLPVPGRHVSRRAAQEPRAVVARAAAAVVPAPLRGRVGLGGAQLAVVAVVVATALSATAWWVLRADARTVEAPGPAGQVEAAADLVALEPVAAPTAAADDEVGPTSEAGGPVAAGEPTAAVPPSPVAGANAEEVTVDVAGKVRRPGVVTLASGSRVVDALDAAGGPRPGVDLSPLNLARVLLDGEQVLVGPVPDGAVPATAAEPPAATASGTPPTALVDLNTADVATLETLPEVGPVTAASIVAWREENGGFTAVEELLEVDGIGEITLSQIAPHATV